MKNTMLIWALKLALRLLLNHVPLKTIIAWVGMEEETDTGNFQKRGTVYNKIKAMENTDATLRVNAAVEMGVVLYRLIKKK